jgi:hypothetical protein
MTMKLHLNTASTGVQWVRKGVQVFSRQPVAMSGLFLMFLAAMSLLGALPLVGNIFALVLLPAATVGLMAASAQAAEGKFPMPKVLFTAFSKGSVQTRAMLLLGCFYAAAFLLVLALTTLADGGQFAKLYLSGGTVTEELILDDRFTQAALLAVLFYLPLSMCFWHAPALVHWNGVTPIKSLFFSMVACIRNFWAFTIFGLTWVSLFIVATTLIAVVVSMIGNPQWAGILLFPTIMVFVTMFFSSIFFTFKDCFESETALPLPVNEQ